MQTNITLPDRIVRGELVYATEFNNLDDFWREGDGTAYVEHNSM